MDNSYLFLVNLFLSCCITLLCKRFGLIGLSAWFVCQALFANLFVLKEINLFGFHTTASDIFAIIANFTIYMIWIEHGSKVAEQTCKLTAVIMLFFAVTCALHVSYQPALCDSTQIAYEILLKPQLYMQLVSQFSWFVSQNFYIFCLNKRAQIVSNKKMTLIVHFCMIILSQIVDSILFATLFLQFYVNNIFSVLLFSLGLKAISTACFIVFMNVQNTYYGYNHAQI